jgi:histidine ammonia-lyase
MIGARGLDEDVLGAMSFEALRGQIAAFDEEILALKPHPGMQRVGANLRALLHGSEVIAASKGIRTQDALSIRSIPQVHGACRDQMAHAERQIETELNGTTDNPLLLGTPDNFRVMSQANPHGESVAMAADVLAIAIAELGGIAERRIDRLINPLLLGTPDNFRIMSQANPHGESVAMAADVLAIAIAELGGIAERRIDRLINPLVSGLPPFLVSEPGVNSGMMIAQYVAASLCAENRQLAQPCVVDNYVTSALQEDHLSLGTGAALRLHKLLANVNQILAIEYLLAAQAFEFLQPQRVGEGTGRAWRLLRQRVEPYHQDRWLAPDIASSAALLQDEQALAEIAPALG